jgi:hypothetical protein
MISSLATEFIKVFKKLSLINANHVKLSINIDHEKWRRKKI